jgi:phospholipid transport system substrate-binding protein
MQPYANSKGRQLYRVACAGLLAMLLTIVANGAVQAAWADKDPMATTQEFVNGALKILADRQTPVADRQRQLRQLIEPHFDFTQMSRQALGPHWRSLSPAQRQDFAQVFKSFMESAYLSKISDYSGQRVEFVKQSSLGVGYAQVASNIMQTGKAPIPVNYLLEQKDDGWKVYDVTVDNISIIQNYRNQFNRVINENGFDKLLADLKAKQRQLSATSAG